MIGGGLFDAFFLLMVGMIVAMVLRAMTRARQVDELRRSGTRVAATVTNIQHRRVQTNAGMPPNPATGGAIPAPTYRDDWFIEAEWTDPRTGVTHRFKSDRLSEFDARRYAAGEPITVLVDPNDPATYYVEIAR